MVDKTVKEAYFKQLPTVNIHSTNTEGLQKYTELRGAYKNVVH
jgi:hypothetical protein